MLVVIDNYDSFTYNLVQYLGELGERPRVFRNDQVTLDELAQLRPDRIVISGAEDTKGSGICCTSSICRRCALGSAWATSVSVTLGGDRRRSAHAARPP
jgi:anthranilate/para-aminobenzoate synthase component II